MIVEPGETIVHALAKEGMSIPVFCSTSAWCWAFGKLNMTSISDYRNAMAWLCGAVNVITTAGLSGQAGFTASAVCSVTDQPPTLLVCMNRSSYAHKAFLENQVLCVNVLSASQQALSALFADRSIAMPQRFEKAKWSALATGAPVLDEALVNLDGRIVQIHQIGTHSIFYVELQAIRIGSHRSAEGLAYFNRAYHSLGMDSTLLSSSNLRA